MDLSLFKSRRSPPSSPPPAALSPLAKAIKDGPQFTVLGDSDHNDEQLRTFFGSDKLFEDMRKAGVKHLFMEQAGRDVKEMLAAIDGKWGGVAAEIGPLERRSPAARKRFEEIRAEALFDAAFAPGATYGYIENTAMMARQVLAVLNARAEGISVHLPDHDGKFEKGRTVDPVHRCYQDSWLKRTLSRTETLEMAGLRERLAQDDRVAERIVKTAGQDKSAIIWGLGHSDPQQGLGVQLQMLGKQNQLIAVTSSNSAANLPVRVKQLASEMGITMRMPDRFFDVAKQDFVALPAAAAAIREAKPYHNKWSGFFCQP